MIISRTPFRISFFGGGTDYPAWYRNYGGSVLATSINKYCYITCRHLPPFFDHRIRLVYSKTETCQTVDEITHPAVRQILRYMNINSGLEIHHDADLPARSGIGSSSSFSVGLLHALYALKGHMPNKKQLAEDSIYIEQESLKETVGSQDQVMAAHGGFNQITFLQSGEISVRPMTLPRDRLDELNSNLMLVFTGFTRTASEIAQTYVLDLEQKKQHLRLMGEMVNEGINILTNGDNLDSFGKLLHEAWCEKMALSPDISNTYINNIYDQARMAGALGGKLVGAGGGGFMLLFVPPSHRNAVGERLRKLLHVPFKFEFSGSQIIFFDPEEDYSELDREREWKTVDTFQEVVTGKVKPRLN